MIDTGGTFKAVGETGGKIVEKLIEKAPEIITGGIEVGKKIFKKNNVGDNKNSVDKEATYNEKTDKQEREPSNNASITEEMLLNVIDEIHRGNGAILEKMSENKALTDEIKKVNEIAEKIHESFEKLQNENYAIIKSKIEKLEKIIYICGGIGLLSLIVSVLAIIL